MPNVAACRKKILLAFFFIVITSLVLSTWLLQSVLASGGITSADGITELVSTDSLGNQANGYVDISLSMSADGRYVAFASSASNLVYGDNNSMMDVFVKDTQTGTTTLVSTDAAGAPANGASGDPSISADGQYVAFDSSATNLVDGDTNNTYDVFEKDLKTGAIARADTDAAGNQANGALYFWDPPAISSDGRYVAFTSRATNLVSGYPSPCTNSSGNPCQDVYLKDMQTGEVRLISSDAAGNRQNDTNNSPGISADGRYVVFDSAIHDNCGFLYMSCKDIYLKDSQSGALTVVSTPAGGSTNTLNSYGRPAISREGRYVAFASGAALVPGVTSKCSGLYGTPIPCGDIYLKDTQLGTTTLVSTDAAGHQSNGRNDDPSISGDGDDVAFDSVATNLVAGYTNQCHDGMGYPCPDVYQKDVHSGVINLISHNSSGNHGNSFSHAGAISTDGYYLAFESSASDLVYGDVNNTNDIFRTHARKEYFWTWYDGANASDWILLANPASSTSGLHYSLSVGGVVETLPVAGQVLAGQSITPSYPGVQGGPVKATTKPGFKGLTSQRILWGNSFEEVLGIGGNSLSDHYWWSWYDQLSPGMTNWVLVANPSAADTVHAVISFVNQADGETIIAESDIAPGANWNPTFAGKMGGPVELRAYKAGGAWPADKMDVIASQRVLSNYGRAFNEVPGIPATDLSDHYLWTWYDQASAGMADWVLVANPGDSQVYYQISIGGSPLPTSPDNNPGIIPVHGKVTPTFAGIINGPVEVKSCSQPFEAGNCPDAGASPSVIASQRVIAGPSFEEVPGYPYANLPSDYHWTWYDMKSAGSANWVLVANPTDAPVSYQISIAGQMMKTDPVNNPGTIPAHGKVTPVFAGTIGGPVEVTSTGGPVMVSQRVIWNGYFNEVLGTVLG